MTQDLVFSEAAVSSNALRSDLHEEVSLPEALPSVRDPFQFVEGVDEGELMLM